MRGVFGVVLVAVLVLLISPCLANNNGRNVFHERKGSSSVNSTTIHTSEGNSSEEILLERKFNRNSGGRQGGQGPRTGSGAGGGGSN
ncbi:hypothetical protein S245_036350, partial [Arachis hypogaea]